MPQKVSKIIQYPAQTGTYKVFVKDKNEWQKYKFARLQISIGNPKHDGEKFFALCEWAAERFEHVTLIVSDSLQRHNISLLSKICIKEAHKNSLSQGDDWLERNQSTIAILPNKFITRWDDWINHPEFAETHKRIQNLYLHDGELREQIDAIAFGFSEKKISTLNHTFLEAMNSVSKIYIIEELAAFAIMMRGPRTADVYPGSWFKELFITLAKYGEDPLLGGFSDAACIRVDFIKNRHPSLEEKTFKII